MLKLNDVFWTFQGEGFYAGKRALFIRMPFCNLSCSWCDTEYNSFKNWTEEDFIDYVKTEKAKFAVITGGEPMMNKTVPRIIEILKSMDFTIACESNGTFPIFEGIDFPTISPKYGAKWEVHPHAFANAKEFKYVVDAQFNFETLERHDVNDGRRYSLSPEFNDQVVQLERITNYIKENPKWQLNLQSHKYVNIK